MRRLATAVACVAFVACEESPRFPSGTPDDVGAARWTQEDTDVIDAVVVAYAAVGEIPGTLSAPPGERRPIPLSEVPERTARSRSRLRDRTREHAELLQPDPGRWWSLTDEKAPSIDVPDSALRDFLTRNRRSAPLTGFHSRYLRLRRTSEGMGSPSGAISTLTFPGYSRARDVAVVEISISTSGLSGGGQMILLRKTQGAWRVIAKQNTWIS